MNEIMVQLIGFIGVAFFIASYQMRSNRLLFLFQMMGCLVFITQFFILGAYTGALSLMVIVLRNILLLNVDKRTWISRRGTMIAVLALLTVATAYTWEGPASLLQFISVGVTTVGYWTNNAQKIRLSQFIGSPCTLIYALIVHSWGAVLNETITLVSIIISVMRFGWSNMKEAGTEF